MGHCPHCDFCHGAGDRAVAWHRDSLILHRKQLAEGSGHWGRQLLHGRRLGLQGGPVHLQELPQRSSSGLEAIQVGRQAAEEGLLCLNFAALGSARGCAVFACLQQFLAALQLVPELGQSAGVWV